MLKSPSIAPRPCWRALRSALTHVEEPLDRPSTLLESSPSTKTQPKDDRMSFRGLSVCFRFIRRQSPWLLSSIFCLKITICHTALAPGHSAPHDADLSQNSSIYIVDRPSNLHATCERLACNMRATSAPAAHNVQSCLCRCSRPGLSLSPPTMSRAVSLAAHSVQSCLCQCPQCSGLSLSLLTVSRAVAVAVRRVQGCLCRCPVSRAVSVAALSFQSCLRRCPQRAGLTHCLIIGRVEPHTKPLTRVCATTERARACIPAHVLVCDASPLSKHGLTGCRGDAYR